MKNKQLIQKKQQGSMLLEGIVAILIFSVGVLGLLGAFAAALKNSSEAQYRSEASFHAESIIAELRTADATSRITDYASPSGSKFLIWKNKIANTSTGLPSAGNTPPTIVFSGTDNKTVEITIQWASKNDSSIHKYTTTTVLE